MGVDSAAAEQLRILKEPYFYVWAVGRKGCPICRRLSGKHISDYNAGENSGKAYERKTIAHRLHIRPHALSRGQ